MQIKNEDLPKKFDHIFKVIQSDGFLTKNTVGGDIPFFISSYAPQQENDVVLEASTLIKRLEKNGVKVLEINLYDLCIKKLKKSNMYEKVLKLEPSRSKDKFLKGLQSSLNVETQLLPMITEQIENNEHNLLIISGVGLVFPFIRSHSILNNIQKVADHKPALIFYPGIYNGASLELFGQFKDDNYYRAFIIDSYKV